MHPRMQHGFINESSETLEYVVVYAGSSARAAHSNAALLGPDQGALESIGVRGQRGLTKEL